MAFIYQPGKIFLFILCCLVSFDSVAQLSRLDSLKKNIHTASSPAEKLQASFVLCDEWESFSPDTLYNYALLARNWAIDQKNNTAILLSDYYLAAYLFQKNKLDTALAAIDAAIVNASKISAYNTTLVKCWFLRVNILLRTSRYDEILKQSFALLTLAEKQHDTIALIRANTGIGNVNMRLQKYSEALNWHYRAQALMQRDALKAACSFVYVNTAIVYYHLAVLNDTKENEDSIEINLQKAIAYSRKSNNLTNLANSLSMYGNTLAEYNKLVPAEAALTEALAIRKKIGDIFYEIIDMEALSSFYQGSNNSEKAIQTCQDALALAKKNPGDFISRVAIYSMLGEIYSGAGDYKKYSEVLKERMSLQDSFYKVNTAEAISEIETKYEVQKKENIIIQQKYDLVRKNYLVYGVLLLLLLGGLFSFILFRQYRKKQKLKLAILQQEEQRMSIIAVATAEEKERQRIAAELHDNLGSQLNYISSNIDFIMDTPAQYPPEDQDKRLSRVNDTVKHAITDLRGTIWALKKENVEMEEVADKIKLHAIDQLSHRQDIRLNVQEHLPVKLILSPAEALNIFRIFQEAVNNAVKYSRSSTIDLSLETNTSPLFRIVLADNGTGFDTTKTYADHYGLENMRERAKEINAVLEIISQKDKGSTIILSKG